MPTTSSTFLPTNFAASISAESFFSVVGFVD